MRDITTLLETIATNPSNDTKELAAKINSNYSSTQQLLMRLLKIGAVRRAKSGKRWVYDINETKFVSNKPGPRPVARDQVVLAQMQGGDFLIPMQAVDIDWDCPGDQVIRYLEIDLSKF